MIDFIDIIEIVDQAIDDVGIPIDNGDHIRLRARVLELLDLATEPPMYRGGIS